MKRLFQHRSKRGMGSTLVLLSILLVVSAVMRLGLIAGPAIAREISQTQSKSDSQETPQNLPQQNTQALQILLTEFQKRELKLKQQEREIEDRLKVVEIAETAIDHKLKQLIDAEDRLRATLAIADGASEGDLTQLTAVYERMKPKETAALFQEMDPEFAAGFLSRMKPELAAGVLAGMAPEAAYTISVVLAGRNANVPTE